MLGDSGIKGFSKFSDVALINNDGRRTSIANNMLSQRRKTEMGKL